MIELPQPTAILLDWDGTISDSLPIIHAGHNAVRAHFNMPGIDREQSSALTMFESRIGLAKLLGDAAKTDEGLQVYSEFLATRHLDALDRDGAGYKGLIPGAADFLDAASSRGLPTGIVTNKRRILFDKELQRLGWQNRFKITVCANETTQNKPSGDPALLALKVMQTEPSKAVWFIGDTEGDMLCAHEAGLTAICVEAARPGWPCDLSADYESLAQALLR